MKERKMRESLKKEIKKKDWNERKRQIEWDQQENIKKKQKEAINQLQLFQKERNEKERKIIQNY